MTVVFLRSPRLPGTPYRILADRRALSTALDRSRPDHLEVHDKIVAVAAARWAAERDVPTVLFSHERIACASHYAAEEFRRIGVSVERIPLGVDLDAFAPRPHPSASPPVVAWVGRLSDEKRPDLAVATLRALVRHRPDVRLLIVVTGRFAHASNVGRRVCRSRRRPGPKPAAVAVAVMVWRKPRRCM